MIDPQIPMQIGEEVDQLRDENARLREELAAAQLDAARIDWLEQHDKRFYNMDKISSVVGDGFSSNAYKTKTKSLREAIDAAMKEVGHE